MQKRSTAGKRMGPPRSPMAPVKIPRLPPLRGVELATAATGIRYKNRTDLLLVKFPEGTSVAGVFTKSATASAPVQWCRGHVAEGHARALLVNSGNANAFTGTAGTQAVAEIAEATANVSGCAPEQVLMASTGVIGEPLPTAKMKRALRELGSVRSPEGWLSAAESIMTTDTYPKLATEVARIGGVRVRINGIAKGSGMIAPDMATMLAFVFTDAALPASVLERLLRDGVQPSFNSITVDSDTSTSDTVLLFATATSPAHPPVQHSDDELLEDFCLKLNRLLLRLALQVVCDGEGAQKLIQVDVSGADSDTSARKVALSIANSPLVKTAISGGDANWGRIVMAVGKAGEPADRDRLKIWFGKVLVAEKGARAARYREETATKAVAGRNVKIRVDLGLGAGTARVYTCDLTERYVQINGRYRS